MKQVPDMVVTVLYMLFDPYSPLVLLVFVKCLFA
jgi:hypothetical protein